MESTKLWESYSDIYSSITGSYESYSDKSNISSMDALVSSLSCGFICACYSCSYFGKFFNHTLENLSVNFILINASKPFSIDIGVLINSLFQRQRREEFRSTIYFLASIFHHPSHTISNCYFTQSTGYCEDCRPNDIYN